MISNSYLHIENCRTILHLSACAIHNALCCSVDAQKSFKVVCVMAVWLHNFMSVHQCYFFGFENI